MRRFNLYRRGKSGVFYCRFFDESTKKWQSGISTGETDERAALATVYGWERDGIPSRDDRSVESVTGTRRLLDQLRTADLGETEARSVLSLLRDRGYVVSAIVAGDIDAGPVGDYLDRPLVEYLEWIWDYDRSPYVENKIRHGHSIGRTHCAGRLSTIRNHWRPWLDSHPVTLAATTRATLDAFSAHLADKDLSAQTKNHILTTGTAALSYAHDVRAIPDDPARGLTFYSGKSAKRGTLTEDEVKKLFSLSWPSEVARLASLTAATTGLREGEIAALTIDDIEDDRLRVRHSWSRRDGLKSSKTGEERAVPLIPAVRDQLRQHAAASPHDGPFVFWTVDPERPMSPRRFYDGLRDALAMLSGMTAAEVRAARRAEWRRGRKKPVEEVDAAAWERFRAILDEWRARRVSFHSWRHHYTATMARIVDRRAMIATGHRSPAVFEVYADHTDAETFREVADAARLAFGFVEVAR